MVEEEPTTSTNGDAESPHRTGKNGTPEGEDRSLRTQIIKIVSDRPGLCIRELAEDLNCAHSTVRHHLQQLSQDGQIQSDRDGRKLRHYRTRDLSDPRAMLAPMLREDERREVVEYVSSRSLGNLSINQVAQDLDLDFDTVKRTLAKLEEAGFIEIEQNAGRYRLTEKQPLSETVSDLG